jgi:predicted DsbA family dithiol-disulfide isomerase
VTIWPAFEAVACAEKQSLVLADDLAWAIRLAFFDECQCISMRHVLMDLAAGSGLDMQQFTADYDSGRCKQQVVQDASDGWERLGVPGSPSWILPSGDVVAEFGLPEIDVDARGRPNLQKRGISRSDCIAQLRVVLDGA